MYMARDGVHLLRLINFGRGVFTCSPLADRAGESLSVASPQRPGSLSPEWPGTFPCKIAEDGFCDDGEGTSGVTASFCTGERDIASNSGLVGPCRPA